MFAQSSNRVQKATRGRVRTPKAPRNGKGFLVNFARSAFGVRGVLAPLSLCLGSLSCARE